MRRVDVFTDGSIQVYPPPQSGKICEIWSMKTWAEVGQPLDGSFSQTVAFDAPIHGTAGVTNRLTIKKPEIDFINSLNIHSEKSWKWAADAPQGLLYQSILGISIYDSVEWNWVGTPSGHTENRNLMCFSAFTDNLAQVVAAPKSTTYEQYLDIPWLIQNIWGNYGAIPLLYKIILLDPMTFPHTKSNGGFWIEKKWLYSKIDTVSVPWL